MVALTQTDAGHVLSGVTRQYPDACAFELFEQQVDRTPEAVAVVFGDRRLTYAEVDRRANQVARFLARRGIGPEALVGVCMQRTPDLVVALLGVWKSGAAYVPIDPAYPKERLSFMVSDAALRVLLIDRSSEPQCPSDGVELVRVDGAEAAEIAKEDASRPAVRVAPSSLAYVMYTSGSTGRPKGAMIVHGGLVNYLCWAIDAYGVEAGGSVPVHSSIAFDLTVTSLYPALLAGGQVELLPEDVGAQNLLAALRRGRGRNLVKITPAHLDLLTRQLRPEELAGVTKLFVVGGENLPAESLTPWRERAPATRIVNEYGPTETVVGCCVHEVQKDDPAHGPVSIGLPIANTQLYVLQEGLAPAPSGAVGELYIGGAGVARGYLNRPELTRERFLPDPFSASAGARMYKTGDLVRRRADGRLEFLGRVDDQVKVRGYRIELGEIEAALASHPDVQSAAVLAREDAPGDKQLVGYVVPREGASPSASVIQSFLGERLPEYMVPPRIVTLRSMPLTVNGKVDRKALPAPSELDAPPSAALRPPRDETEKAIAAIWCELLRVQEVGLDSDFFEIGGHSLSAVKALAMVRDAMGVDLPLESLFEHSTLEKFAAVVASATGPKETAPRIPPRKEDGPCLASFAEEQMWLLQQLSPGSPAYNILDVVPLRGPYVAAALERALRELVSRHAILRTTFSRETGDLVQIVHPPFALQLKEVDLRGASPERTAAEWKRVVREAGHETFDLSRLPLLRATIVHRSENEHDVLIVVHHVIADEWSMELVHRELRELYEAFVEGRTPRVDRLPIQYADYSVWQRESLRGGAMETQLAHWSRELAGAVPSISLPVDRPHPAVPTGRGATERFELPLRVREGLQALCRQEQATLFMGLEAVFASLLHRMTGQDDILVGTPISNRTHAETQNLVGCFLNTVVLRSRFEQQQTFRALLQQVRTHAVAAYAHAEVPFNRVVAHLSPARDPGRTPLFQVMFILHDRDGVSEVSKLNSPHRLETDTSKFDLTLFLSETDRGLAGLIEYNTDVFDPETIRQFQRSYGRLLEEIVRAPDRAIGSLPMLADADRHRLLVEWNDTATSFDEASACLHELFARQAARTPARPALVCEGVTLTYRDLDRRSDALARRLVSLGVGPDVLVGLLFERSADMVIGLLGVLKAGGAYVPLDPSFPPDRLAHMIRDSGMPVLVTHAAAKATLDALPERPRDLVHLDDAQLPGDDAPLPPSAVQPRNLAYVLYTSGSTGLPKGVAIPHAAIVNFVLSIKREPGIRETDTMVAVTTLSFDIAALELYVPLVTGAKVVVASRRDVLDPHRLAGLMSASGCTMMQATPSTWRSLVEAGWSGSPGLVALCGGEAMPPALAGALLPRCRELWNMYGPTETTVWSTLHRMTPSDSQPPIGHPIANTQVYVLDGRMEPVPPGVAGELYIGGDGLAREYLNRPELTAERFVASPFQANARLYRTGDLARWRAGGTLECLGRTDHQVKIRGYRIELGEIEACLARDPGVRQAVVVAREDVPGDKQLVAYVVPRAEAPQLVEELRRVLRAALPDYMVPAHFVTLDKLPLTPNGKVDRKALPAPAVGGPSRDGSFVAPTTELELSLAAAWRRVLGVERVGIEDNFFELGGDSLKVLKLIVQMERTSGIEIDMGAVFRFPTIAALVKSLGSDAAKAASMAVPLQSEGNGLPVFCLCGINLYQDFATALGKDQPTYGLYVPEEQVLARSALEGAKVDIDIPSLARAYYESIKRVAPRGPYRLAGSSFGGIVALEVASLMRQGGESVDVVALLDTLSPRGIRRNWVTWAFRRARQVITGEAGRKVLLEVAKLQDRLVARGWLPGDRDPERVAEEAYALKQQAYFAAIRTWRTRRFVADYRIVLFRATEQGWGPQDELDEDYGWRHYLSSPLAVVDVPGDHLGILKPPNVTELALKVREQLGRSVLGPDGP